MERRKRARVKHQEEVLAAHLAELKVDLANKDAHAAAKLGRLVYELDSRRELLSRGAVAAQRRCAHAVMACVVCLQDSCCHGNSAL